MKIFCEETLYLFRHGCLWLEKETIDEVIYQIEGRVFHQLSKHCEVC